VNNLDKYFKALELKPGASLDEIKQAYRDLAQIWHPDKYTKNPRLQERAEERFKLINEAYQILLAKSQTYPRNESRDTHDTAGNTQGEAKESNQPPFSDKQKQTKKSNWKQVAVGIVLFTIISGVFKVIKESYHPNDSQKTYQQIVEEYQRFLQAHPELVGAVGVPEYAQAMNEKTGTHAYDAGLVKTYQQIVEEYQRFLQAHPELVGVVGVPEYAQAMNEKTGTHAYDAGLVPNATTPSATPQTTTP